MASNAELLQSLLDQAQELSHRDEDELDALRQRAGMLIRRIFGHNSFYLESLRHIDFRPRVLSMVTTEDDESSAWGSGHKSIINLVNTMLEDVGEFSSTTPVLMIKDDELRTRTLDLLSAPGHYDRVLREATTILEHRIRSKVPFEDLAKLIPNAADQTGDTLVNKLFNAQEPFVVCGERQQQAGVFRILGGVLAYLRNPSHHSIDDDTAWSWAWSVVGLVDQLLDVIDSAEYRRPTGI